MAKNKAKPVKKGEHYKASILIWGKRYDAIAFTLTDALACLNVPNPKGKSILTISKGDKTKERILSPVATFRLLASHGLMREVALKNTSLLFDL